MKSKCELGHLVYELTEACNQNCRFCYNHWRPDGCAPVDKQLARRTLARILRQAKVGSISFSGGEPTLLSNIHDLALKCRFKGAGVNILTNGTLLTEDDILNFNSIGVSAIQIPLLSHDPAVHDYLTGTPGSWEKACKSINSVLVTMGSEHFAAVLIVTAKNAERLPATLDFYNTLGVQTVMVNRFNLGGNGLKHRGELCLSREGLRSAFKLINDFALHHARINFVSGVCTPVCLLDPFQFPFIRFTTCSTDVESRPITISYRGDVRFCNHSPFVLGNIWERDLSDILEDKSILAHYSGVPEQCSECRLYPRCKGGCRAASEQVYGSFDLVDPIIEIQ